MLDVGISSTLQIANFWGLVPAVTEREAETIRLDAGSAGRPAEATQFAVWLANAHTPAVNRTPTPRAA
jgi:hypothetical protein